MRLSVHVLDTFRGLPGAGVPVTLTDPAGTPLASGTTDADGRIPALWAGSAADGAHRLLFDLSALWPEVPDRLVEAVEVRVRLAPAAGEDAGPPREHLHVPLLAGPYSATTYRGT